MADFTSLKTPGLVGDSQLTVQLEGNITAFLDWALLGLGGFYNVRLNSAQAYGGNPSKLRLGDDRRFPRGMVWDGFRNNWIWETNVEGAAQPISISGVYVNSNFYPTGTVGAYSFNVDYPRGRVVFDSPIPHNSVVQMEYSYKLYDVCPASVQWFKSLMQGTYRLDDMQFNAFGSGLWNILPESRAQLPAIVVESVPRRNSVGYQLGGGQWIFTNVYFHVMAAVEPMRDNIIDILTYQQEKKFFFFDKSMVARSGMYPLNASGFLVNPQSTYPYLVNNFMWRYAIINDITSEQLADNSQSVFRGVAKWKLQVEFPEI